MDQVEKAHTQPRGTFGMARTSLANISFPEEGAIELIGFGRIATDLHRRIPEERFDALLEAWNVDAARTGCDPIDEDQLRSMMEDAEAATLHWAADSLRRDRPPISTAVANALNGLADAIGCLQSANVNDRALFRKFLIYIMPDMLEPMRRRDALDVELLTAANAVARRGREPDIGSATTWLLDAMIDDWRRHTGRRVTQAVGASSAYGFIASFFGLTRAFALEGQGGAVSEALVQRKAELGAPLDAPLRKAIRGAATRLTD